MYQIQYTERNNKKASEYETRSLLYLLTMRADSEEISLFFIDCLNDLTGSNESCSTLWDTQSKGVNSLNPTKIGESLITLFENYISELEFNFHILLMPKLKEGYLVDESLLTFGFNNFLSEKKTYIIDGLKNEYKRRNNNNISQNIIGNVDQFLQKTVFVIGQEKEKYIQEIVHFKNKDSHSSDFYSSIFDEIRDKQTALKNINIEGVKIQHPSELVAYKKLLKGNDIKLMVLNRFIGTELFKSDIPIYYLDEIKGMDRQDVKDLIQENNSKISRTFFNKNNKNSFWLLLENIMLVFAKDTNAEIRNIYDQIDKKLLKANYTMDEKSVLFFISLIKSGINVNN